MRKAKVMAGVLPSTLDARAERRAGWTFTAIGLAGLAGSAVWTALEDPAKLSEPATIALLAASALWLSTVVWLFPRRATHPALILGFYLGFLALATSLSVHGEQFVAFASVGFPLAFALLPPRWSFFAVAATAIVPLVSRETEGDRLPTWLVIAAISAPLLYAGWIVGSESEKRRRANEELATANARLESALAENAGLHAQLLHQAREAGVLDERQRLAGEIHDTIAQGLAGIVTQVQAAERHEKDSVRLRHHLANARALAAENLTEARRSVHALRPERLDDARLPDAMAELARAWTETSGVPVKLTTTGDPRPLQPELEIALYRVAQESLANIGKHAGATVAGLTLSYSDDLVLLDVRDDGVGFTPGEETGFGLAGMRRRLQRVAGTLTVESAPGEGVAVSAQVPAIITVEEGER